MTSIYSQIIRASSQKEKHLVVLIDPDKMALGNVETFVKKVNRSVASFIFVGGSTVEANQTEQLVLEIKKHTVLPVLIFPGDINQITEAADGLLFLSLISGRNPDYLIGKHVKSVEKLRNTSLEIIPTGYILIENGKETAVQRVTETQPMARDEVQLIVDTAKAGELMGKKMIYLEAGSGAVNAISSDIIQKVKDELSIPLIVGGGIRSKRQLDAAFNAGADVVVIGTAFEEDDAFFEELKHRKTTT